MDPTWLDIALFESTEMSARLMLFSDQYKSAVNPSQLRRLPMNLLSRCKSCRGPLEGLKSTLAASPRLNTAESNVYACDQVGSDDVSCPCPSHSSYGVGDRFGPFFFRD